MDTYSFQIWSTEGTMGPWHTHQMYSIFHRSIRSFISFIHAPPSVHVRLGMSVWDIRQQLPRIWIPRVGGDPWATLSTTWKSWIIPWHCEWIRLLSLIRYFVLFFLGFIRRSAAYWWWACLDELHFQTKEAPIICHLSSFYTTHVVEWNVYGWYVALLFWHMFYFYLIV